MKYIFILIAIMTLTILPQSKTEQKVSSITVQDKEWMTKISSDYEMRNTMVTMILDKSSGSKEELTRIAKTILNNPGMNSVLTGMLKEKSNNRSISTEARGVSVDTTNRLKMLTPHVISDRDDK
jgi:hypothetical protein